MLSHFFFLSLVLNFCGAFLTLDRTRSFVPTEDVIEPNTTFLTPFFHGGIGGIISGCVLGLHLSTFLSLLIPSLGGSKPLSSGSFLAIWLLSALSVAIVTGRWKYAALISAGVSGGAALALSLSVIIHPSLITRVVLVSVFVPLLTVLTVLPLPHFQPIFLRLSLSSTGAFGIILSIALMAQIPAWENVWGRLWVEDSLSWGTIQEKGLSTGFCLFLLAGTTSDWFLKTRFGENPDQKWDNYLAEYVANLPDSPERAGSFQPLTSVWGKLFGPPPPPTGTLYNNNLAENNHQTDPENLPPAFRHGKLPGFFHRHKRHAVPLSGRKRAIKFISLDFDDASDLDSDSDSDDAKLRTPISSIAVHSRPAMVKQPTNAVAVQDDSPIDKPDISHRIKLGQKKSLASQKLPVDVGVYDYLDHEDITTETQISHEHFPWSPPFLRRHRATDDLSSTKFSYSSNDTDETRVPPPNAVRVSMDPVGITEGQAYLPFRSGIGFSTPQEKPSNLLVGRTQWDGFWEDVHHKATQ